MAGSDVQISKFLSFVLRHRPEAIGLSVDREGWADVDELLEKAREHGRSISKETLRRVVATNKKQRFAFNADKSRIRANQGHSISVELGLPALEPPATLFHGTARRYLDAIKERGLLKGRRQHVHLSSDRATAIQVGKRHGKPIVLLVRAGAMHAAGYRFHLSENKVWLTEQVPPAYITVERDEDRTSGRGG